MFELVQLFLLDCQVPVFSSAQPCLSVSHTLKCQELKPWLKKELLTEEKSMSGSPRDNQKGRIVLFVFVCLTCLLTYVGMYACVVTQPQHVVQSLAELTWPLAEEKWPPETD